MKNPICISTGFVYKISEDMNEKIRLLKQFSADGIELNFAFSRDLINFKITQDNLEYLKDKRITIHAPWKDITYGDNINCINTLDSIQELYNKTNAVLVNLHKSSEDDLSILKKYNFFSTIENDDWIGDLSSTKQLQEILKQNPNLGFTFDFAHSLSVSLELTTEYLAKLRNKMTQIHISYLDKTMKDHYFLYKHNTKKIECLLKLIPENVPLVLEAVASDETELPLIRKEVDYFRDF